MYTRGIQCCETQRYSKEKWNGITYEFACELEGIPEQVVVRPGDPDPTNGTVLDNPAFFERYRKDRNNEVKKNLEAIGRLTSQQSADRKELRAEIADEYQMKHGCPPEDSELEKMLNQRWPIPKVFYFDKDPTKEEGEKNVRGMDLADHRAEECLIGNESDDTTALREFATGLRNLERVIYRKMLEIVDAGAERPTWPQIAEDLGCSLMTACRYRDRIVKKIMHYSATVHRFSYDRRGEDQRR